MESSEESGLSLQESIRRKINSFTSGALQEVKTLSTWEKIREERKAEFWRCLGLSPQPRDSDLSLREFSQFSGQGWRARTLGFQLLPDCWSSAVTYYPDPLPAKPCPAVLYVCGHGKTGVWHYQTAAIMWARRGYVCLVLDTIEQHDNPGEHHGSIMGKWNHWLALGYTPAGAEAWNAMRAMAVLQSDPAVDPERIGVTGISGGGACSFYAAVLDEKIKALATLCGLSTPKDAVVNARAEGHCNCIYSHNLYSRDLSEYAALLAPRPALFCFGDKDSLYTPEETKAFVDRTRSIYALYGKEDLCELLAYPCGHEDHPVFSRRTQEWFDLHVAGEEHPILKRGEKEVDLRTTSVFQGAPPSPNFTHLLPELLSPRGTPALPDSGEDLRELRKKVLQELQLNRPSQDAGMEVLYQWERDGRTRSRHEGSIQGMRLTLHSVFHDKSTDLVLSLVSSGETFHHPFTDLALPGGNLSFAALEGRLSGLNFSLDPGIPFPAGSRPPGATTRMQMRLMLSGQSPLGIAIEDLLAGLRHLRETEPFGSRRLHLYGKGNTALAALYAALIDESVTGVLLEDLPATHTEGWALPGVLRVLDIPHAVGLLAPRKTALATSGHNNWNWTKEAFRRLDADSNLVFSDDFNSLLRFLVTES
jgi:dienelactone hydrolase